MGRPPNAPPAPAKKGVISKAKAAPSKPPPAMKNKDKVLAPKASTTRPHRGSTQASKPPSTKRAREVVEENEDQEDNEGL